MLEIVVLIDIIFKMEDFGLLVSLIFFLIILLFIYMFVSLELAKTEATRCNIRFSLAIA